MKNVIMESIGKWSQEDFKSDMEKPKGWHNV